MVNSSKAKSILGSLVFLLQLCGLSATAAPADYAPWIQSHVSFKSCAPEEIALINDSLSVGFDRLNDLNPALLQNRLAGNSSRRAIFDCASTLKKGSIAAADTSTKGQMALFGLIRIGKRYDLSVARIRIGQILDGTKAADESLHAVIFHEFLHFLNFDNLETTDHNDPAVILSGPFVLDHPNDRSQFVGHVLLGKELDVVYSCSIEAFASENPRSANEKTRLTCAQAKLIRDQVTLSTADLPFLPDSIRNSRASIGCLIHRSHAVDYGRWLTHVSECATP